MSAEPETSVDLHPRCDSPTRECSCAARLFVVDGLSLISPVGTRHATTSQGTGENPSYCSLFGSTDEGADVVGEGRGARGCHDK